MKELEKLKLAIVNSSKVQANYPEIVINLLNDIFEISRLHDGYFKVCGTLEEVSLLSEWGTIDTLRIHHNRAQNYYCFYGFHSNKRSTRERLELDSFKI